LSLRSTRSPLHKKGSEARMFFFEKKNQKTFGTGVVFDAAAYTQTNKSLLLLFFRKEGLPSC
jgi:hypothetical protein